MPVYTSSGGGVFNPLTANLDAGGYNISNGGTFTATSLAGTLTTAAQTNVTSVGTLTSLAVSGALTLGTSGIMVGGTNLIEQYNSTNAQTFNLYNTRTDASNYERAAAYWSSNLFILEGIQAAGTGTSNRSMAVRSGGNLYLRAGNGWPTIFECGTTGVWNIIGATFEFAPMANNSYDLGATAKLIRTGYFGTSVVSPLFRASSASILTLSTDGKALLTNSAASAGGIIDVTTNGTFKLFGTDGTTPAPINIGIPRFNGTNSTGAGTALLGTNSPASTLSAPTTWVTITTAAGATGYIPVWV